MARQPFTRGAILVLLLLHGPAPGSAQAPALGESGQVGAALTLRSGVTWLSSRPLPILAIGGALRLSTSVELGAEAIFGLGAIRLSPPPSADRSELRTGYGGALIRWRPAGDATGLRWAGGLMMGAGAARLSSPLVGSTIVSENYFLIEPRFDVLARQDHPLRLFAEAAYRIVLGADPLPGVKVTELRGPSLSVAVQYVLDP